jgi:hypothetical protein
MGKKKCRVYKKMPMAQTGVSRIPPWQRPQQQEAPAPYVGTKQPGPGAKKAPWQPPTTQDSQKDNVGPDKSNNFMAWLHNSNILAKDKALLKEDMAKIDSGEYKIGGNIDERSGYESGDYGQKMDRNLGYFQAAVANMSDPLENIASIASGLNAMGGFDGFNGFNPGQSEATTPQNSESYNVTDPQSTDAVPNQGFGSEQPDTFGRNTDQSFGGDNPSGVQLGDSFKKPAFNADLYRQKGGGVSYPGQMPLMEEIDDTLWADNKHNPYATSAEAFEEYADEDELGKWEQVEEDTQFQSPYQPNTDEPFKKNSDGIPNQGFGSFRPDTFGATGLASHASNMKKDKKLKNRFSNVFENNKVLGPDDGGYAVNTGTGGNFKMRNTYAGGYNTITKAQTGVTIQDNTRVAPPYIPQGTIEEQIAEAELREQQLEQLNSPYTAIAVPDYNSTFSNDSVRFFPGQRGSKVPYIRDLGNLAGVTGEYSSDDYLHMVNNGNGRMYQDTSRVEANPDYMYRQQGGQYNVDDEIELSEAEINNLIAQGYNLEYI